MPSQAVVINGSIATTDWFSFDDFGTFYVDACELTVSSDTNVTVSLFSADFAPYVAMWDTDVLPTSAWQTVGVDIYLLAQNIDLKDFPGETASFTFSALAGVTYQLAATTTYYLENLVEAALGDYELTITAASTSATLDVSAIPDPTAVPEPTSLLLVATGLLAAGARRRVRR